MDYPWKLRSKPFSAHGGQDPIEKKKPSDLGYTNLFEARSNVTPVIAPCRCTQPVQADSLACSICVDGLPVQVSDQNPEQVQASIEKVAAEAISEVLDGNGLRYSLAQRGTGNCKIFRP